MQQQPKLEDHRFDGKKDKKCKSAFHEGMGSLLAHNRNGEATVGLFGTKPECIVGP